MNRDKKRSPYYSGFLVLAGVLLMIATFWFTSGEWQILDYAKAGLAAFLIGLGALQLTQSEK